MKKIAQIENGFITNVSIGDETYMLKTNEMLLEDALNSGLNYFVKESIKTGLHVLPEDFYLSDSNSDETEFNKLITLCKLGIEQNVLTENSDIKIKDSDGNIHVISISRFFEIMVQYGFHCYNNRNY